MLRLFCAACAAQVWDNDAFSSNTAMALVRYPLSACVVLPTEASRPPPPKWHDLTDLNGDSIGASLLCCAVRARGGRARAIRASFAL